MSSPSPLSRRTLLKLGAAGVGTAAGAAIIGTELGTSGAGARPHAHAAVPAQPPAAEPSPAASAAHWPAAPRGTTLAHRIVFGEPDAHGYVYLHAGAGEPTTARTELLGHRTRSSTRTPLLAFVQLTDTHVIDAQSPNRFSYVAQFVTARKQGGKLHPAFAGVYRPWEMLTAHVAESMVRAVTALAGGPVTGRPMDFTITTGDNADSAQRNEIRWHIDLLDGDTEVRPDSGDPARWEGVAGRDDRADYYWHPDAGTHDSYLREHGFPTVPGLLDRARAPFRAQGVGMPWFAVFGNHDGLPFGMAEHQADLDAVAAGGVRRVALPYRPSDHLLDHLAEADNSALRQMLTHGATEHVTPDAARRPISPQQVVKEYFDTTGTPVGHGFTEDNVRHGTAYYAFTHNGVRCLCLDTVNPAGYFQGSLDQQQFAWLETQLRAASSRHLDARGRWVTGSGTDALVLVFSHHTMATMTNTRGGNRVTGDRVLDLLLRFPNVVAWVNGHRHVNDVQPHARPSGWSAGSGLWEITTASHVDWPQQSRTVEVVDNHDSVSVFATVVDHAGPPRWSGRPSTPTQLASLARELSVNDPHSSRRMSPGRHPSGRRLDRNVELLVAKPF